MSDSPDPRIAKLRAHLASLDTLRGVLDDAALDTQRAEIESRLAALIDTGGGTFIGGDVLAGRDVVGRDQLAALGPGSVVIGGDARGLILVTGNGAQVQLATEDATPDILLAAYYRGLAAECSRLPLGVVDPKFAAPGRGSEVDLPSVYTDLHVVSLSPQDGEDARRFGLRLARGELQAGQGERQPLLDLVSGERGARLVLVGDAGSGKSTFVDYLSYKLADAWAGGQTEALPPVLRGLLPVRLVLRRIAPPIPEAAAAGRPDLIWQALDADIAARLGTAAAERLLPHLQARLLDPAQGGLILLDGLDEVPESDRRRERLLDSVRTFAASLPGRSRVLVTARPYAYARPEWRLPGFAEAAIAPFDAGQVEGFIAHWYRAVRPVMGWDATAAELKGRALAEAIRAADYLGDLASRPLLLTLMATLHTSWGQLPEDRADLYEESVKLLVGRWQTAREVPGPDGRPAREPGIALALGLGEARLRRALNRLAFDTHEAQSALPERDDSPADISRAQVMDCFSRHCPDELNARVLVDYLETRAGLLVARREGVYAFPHRTFQEYLTACHLSDTEPDLGAELKRRVWADPAWWREVWLLAVGKKRQGGLADAVNLVNALVPESPAETDRIEERHWQAAVLAGQALLELRRHAELAGGDHFGVTLKRVRAWLVDLVRGGGLAPKERAEAGDVLGRLGDPRFDPDRLWLPKPLPGREREPLGFVPIAPGPFVMGSRKGGKDVSSDELGNPAKLRIDYPYWISPYPVTVDQYRCFVEGGGYEDPRWWSALGWDWRTGRYDTKADDVIKDWLAQRPAETRGEPFDWSGQSSFGNRPVVNVSWFEAMAFAAWLDSQARVHGLGLPEAYALRLPTEAEWEKAARGPRGRIYAWGNEWDEARANIAGSLSRECAVGIYPGGATPDGVLDLTGNVWEWCRTLYVEYPYVPDDGRNDPRSDGRRSVRGGSWVNVLRFGRCAYRFRLDPDYYFRPLGFRLVLSLADSGF